VIRCSRSIACSLTRRGYRLPKTITLQAHLVDEYGNGMSGRKVAFVLGSQSATGTTDSSGNASINIKLNQKTGVYTVQGRSRLTAAGSAR
jgi:Bacterial Ig-like domain (group 1)